jgi:hypothetical protein
MTPHKNQPAPAPSATAAASLTAVGNLVAAKTELAKISTLVLPNAYREFGKEVYKRGQVRDAFEDLFKQLDLLNHQRQTIRGQAGEQAAATTFADKARRAALDATRLAKTKAIELQADQAFAKLGQAVYERHGISGASEAVGASIAHALERREQIKQQLASIEAGSKGRWVTPNRILGGVVALVVLVVLWIVSGPRWPTVSSATANGRISVSDFESVRRGVAKFAVEDLLGPPLRRTMNTEQRRVYGSRGETFGFEHVNTIVFDYELAGDPNRIARFVFRGRGTNPPLENKSLLSR